MPRIKWIFIFSSVTLSFERNCRTQKYTADMIFDWITIVLDMFLIVSTINRRYETTINTKRVVAWPYQLFTNRFFIPSQWIKFVCAFTTWKVNIIFVKVPLNLFFNFDKNSVFISEQEANNRRSTNFFRL